MIKKVFKMFKNNNNFNKNNNSNQMLVVFKQIL